MKFSDIKGRYAQIKDYPDYYITEHGEIYSTRKIGASKTGKLHKLTPKNPGKADKYYNIILINDNGDKTFSVHRLVAEYFVDGYFDGAVVNHIDGNNRNNDASNLEWVTHKTNIHKSYITSGVNQYRHYKMWSLFDPSGNLVGEFKGHNRMSDYCIKHNLNVSPSSLTKYRTSKGYHVITC